MYYNRNRNWEYLFVTRDMYRIMSGLLKQPIYGNRKYNITIKNIENKSLDKNNKIVYKYIDKTYNIKILKEFHLNNIKNIYNAYVKDKNTIVFKSRYNNYRRI